MTTATTRNRVRHPVRRPTHPEPAAGAHLVGRMAGALRRRMGYAWSQLTVAGGTPTAEAAMDWLAGHRGTDGIPAVAGDAAGCPAVTAAAIETALDFGRPDLARRWAAWLVSIQRSDGSLPDESLGAASLLSTVGAARGLLALERELPGVRAAASEACGYLRSRINEDGRISAPQTRLDGSTSRPRCSRVHLACVPLLLDAARRFSRPDWEAAARRALTYDRHAANSTWPNRPTHAAAWWIEALIDLDRCDAAAHAMHPIEILQRRNGSVPALPAAGWVSSAGMAHLAVCWYKLAINLGESCDRADRAMRFLAGRQRRSGGFLGGWGRGAPNHCRAENAWTAKHFLDASRLQVRAAFEAGGHQLPDRIDPADGRVQAVRRWMEHLPSDARVADVGCGKGRFLRHLSACSPAARLVGIDVSAAMLAELPPRVTGLQGSLLRIPAADGAFDAALAVESLEHSLLPRQAVAELCRIVRPGGRILIIDKHRRRQGLSLHEPWERWFTPEELATWLSRHCDEVTVEPISHLDGQREAGLFLGARGRVRRD